MAKTGRKGKSKRGFAAMSADRRREIARKGAEARHRSSMINQGDLL